jgi:hypothetical protein
MAAVTFQEFDTTAASLVADIKAKILLATDWTNITGDIVKSTTLGGADLIINLAKVAGEARGLSTSFWRLHNGTTGTDESATKTAHTRAVAASTGTATSDPIHCIVAAGKNHLLITVEGARPGEIINAETTNVRDFILLSDVVRYRDDDATPCVFGAGRDVAVTAAALPYRTGLLSRNRAGSAAWRPSLVATMGQPASVAAVNQLVHVSDDDIATLYPYLIIDQAEGLRGRLRNILNGGQAYNAISTDVAQIVPGMKFAYGGVTWIAMPILKSPGTSIMGSAMHLMSTANTHEGPLVMVPFSGDI